MLSNVFFCRHHGAHERSRRCSEMHQQCWEAWETSGADQALLQGYCALPNCHDEARWVFDVLLIRWDKLWLVPDFDERFEAFQLMTLLYHTGYIGEFEIIDDHRAGKIVVNLTGRLNKVQVCFLFPHLKRCCSWYSVFLLLYFEKYWLFVLQDCWIKYKHLNSTLKKLSHFRFLEWERYLSLYVHFVKGGFECDCCFLSVWRDQPTFWSPAQGPGEVAEQPVAL